MQSHHQYPPTISLKLPSRGKIDHQSDIITLNLCLRDETRGLEYELENNSYFNFKRRLNSYIKSYYFSHPFKDEFGLEVVKNDEDLEPFKNRHNFLFISVFDVEKLQQRIPDLFSGAPSSDKSFSNPILETEQSPITHEIIQQFLSSTYKKDSNTAGSETTNTSRKKRRTPYINKENVEMLVQQFQQEQEFFGESIPQGTVDHENVKATFQNFISTKNNSGYLNPSTANIDGLFQEVSIKQNHGINEENNNTYVKLVKQFPKYTKKRKKRNTGIVEEDQSEESQTITQAPFVFFPEDLQKNITAEAEFDALEELEKFLSQESEKEKKKEANGSEGIKYDFKS